MIARTETLHAKIGTCPACKGGLHAEVDVQVELGKPSITQAKDDLAVHVNCSPTIVAMRISHECDKRATTEASS